MAPKLSPFEGKSVNRSTVKITNAGDGLSQALGIEPVEYHQGDKVYVVLECDVSRVSFEPVSKDLLDGPQVRVHTFKAGTATVVDAKLVSDAVEEQAKRNKLAEDEKRGQERLVGADGDDSKPNPAAKPTKGNLRYDPKDPAAAKAAATKPAKKAPAKAAAKKARPAGQAKPSLKSVK